MSIRLENWSVGPHPKGGICLQGNVYGHPNPRHSDGKRIHTSQVKGLRHGDIITESSNRYALGKVDPNYEEAFPDAAGRLLQTLPVLP